MQKHRPIPAYNDTTFHTQPLISTFSIAAIDAATGELSAAVASRYIAVGSLVPHVALDAGVVLTQSIANPIFGSQGLALLATGTAPAEVIDKLLATDPDSRIRQIAVLSIEGQTAVYSGSDCVPSVGESSAPGVVCIGNTLTSSGITDSMLDSFLRTPGPLWDRLVSALKAGESAGGDKRGKQAAALRVHRNRGGYGGHGEVLIDLRVDDHADPVTELERILSVFVTGEYISEHRHPPGDRQDGE